MKSLEAERRTIRRRKARWPLDPIQFSSTRRRTPTWNQEYQAYMKNMLNRLSPVEMNGRTACDLTAGNTFWKRCRGAVLIRQRPLGCPSDAVKLDTGDFERENEELIKQGRIIDSPKVKCRSKRWFEESWAQIQNLWTDIPAIFTSPRAPRLSNAEAARTLGTHYLGFVTRRRHSA
jgi:hypothetical protein